MKIVQSLQNMAYIGYNLCKASEDKDLQLGEPIATCGGQVCWKIEAMFKIAIAVTKLFASVSLCRI